MNCQLYYFLQELLKQAKAITGTSETAIKEPTACKKFHNNLTAS